VSVNTSQKNSLPSPGCTRTDHTAWSCPVTLPGGLLHVLELRTIFKGRGDEGSTHRARRTPRIEPKLGGIFPHQRWMASGPCSGTPATLPLYWSSRPPIMTYTARSALSTDCPISAHNRRLAPRARNRRRAASTDLRTRYQALHFDSSVTGRQLGDLPNMIQPPLLGVVNAASAVSARTLTCRAPAVPRSCSMLSVYIAVRQRPVPRLPPLEENGCGPSTRISPA
jgi:hypothetical protein